MSGPRQGVFPAALDDPFATEATQPFWDAALKGVLVVSRCTNCGTCLLPPAPVCFNCQHDGFEWVELPGTGTVYSFTVVRHPLRPDLAEVVPYVSGVIELDGTQGAGCRMLANIVDCDPDAVRIGDRVRVAFDRVSDTYAVPRFVPA
ncbi:MAG TPA: Zn-ribbon domain-containing OB-fold protein [Acidimicrobiales bacterium]|nr:Zn-ribbon domain-containing OB-fold protein [Acidimicrobiales bacterium]